jgi:hypothetical protein
MKAKPVKAGGRGTVTVATTVAMVTAATTAPTWTDDTARTASVQGRRCG